MLLHVSNVPSRHVAHVRQIAPYYSGINGAPLYLTNSTFELIFFYQNQLNWKSELCAKHKHKTGNVNRKKCLRD